MYFGAKADHMAHGSEVATTHQYINYGVVATTLSRVKSFY
jgi:hypothetical protein